MARSPSLSDLARQLLASAEEIEAFEGGMQFHELPKVLNTTRIKFLETTQELQVRVTRPSEFLEQCQVHVWF